MPARVQFGELAVLNDKADLFALYTKVVVLLVPLLILAELWMSARAALGRLHTAYL